MPASVKAERVVHVAKGQTLVVKVRGGCTLEVTRMPSGAVTVRNGNTGNTIRSWGPKDRD